ncbi:hypothetical protein [Streptomyces sp. NPDC046985]|uniref:hypothetical protein n=1 Tax=Streptomyces sp. NPDC046985 TaxID=3155377 RepID=UPI0033C69CB4
MAAHLAEAVVASPFVDAGEALYTAAGPFDEWCVVSVLLGFDEALAGDPAEGPLLTADVNEFPEGFRLGQFSEPLRLPRSAAPSLEPANLETRLAVLRIRFLMVAMGRHSRLKIRPRSAAV